MSNKITAEEILASCFGKHETYTDRLPVEVIEGIKKSREKRRAEIRENIEIAILQKIHGKNVKIVENKNETRLETTRQRLRLKLLEKENRKIG